MPRVFISHSSLDYELVEREIISPLRAHGVETWYSTDNIKSASEWERQIREGLKESDWFLIALSPRSVSSEWVGREVHWAFLKRKERIIPVMLETCEPDELHLGLLPLQFIDFRNDVAKAQDKLLAVWGLSKAAQVETHYRAAQDALAREDWSTAAEYLEEVLRLDPSHTQAEAELKRARQRQELAATYEAGINDLRNGRRRDALTALHRVQEMDGDYKDVADLIARAKSELQKEDATQLYSEAREAAEREAWAEAAELFEAVLKLDPSHAEAQTALARARRQAELAELYESGREHLRAERWREALKSFRRVRAVDKSYGGVADLIAEADAGLEEEETRRSQEREEEERKANESVRRVHVVNKSYGKVTDLLAELNAKREAEEARRSEREEEEQKAKEETARRDREAKEKAAQQERRWQVLQERERQAKERLYREALEAFDRKDWGAAGKKLRSAKAADPGNKEITAKLAEVERQQKLARLFNSGMRHMENEHWAEALDAFRQVRKEAGYYKDVSIQIARAETMLRRLHEKERKGQEQEKKQKLEEPQLQEQETQPQKQPAGEGDGQRNRAVEQQHQAKTETEQNNPVFQMPHGAETTPGFHGEIVIAVVVLIGFTLLLIFVVLASR